MQKPDRRHRDFQGGGRQRRRRSPQRSRAFRWSAASPPRSSSCCIRCPWSMCSCHRSSASPRSRRPNNGRRIRGPDEPVAFTVKMPSPKDGVLISTNYFPAYTVAADPVARRQHPRSSTVRAWRQRAISTHRAGYGRRTRSWSRNCMRSAGYNVVTWDPRGEFDSGGILQLDSPAYEGQDVTGHHQLALGQSSTTPINSSIPKPATPVTPTTRLSAWSADRTAAAFSWSQRASIRPCRCHRAGNRLEQPAATPFTRTKRSRPRTRRCCCCRW